MNNNSYYWLVGLAIIVIIIIMVYLGYKSLNLNSQGFNQAASINLGVSPSPNTLSLTSRAFQGGQSIPSEFTCDGSGSNPPFDINNVPSGTQSLVLTMYDPDVPTAVRPAGFFDHWVVFNLPASTTHLDTGTTLGTSGNNGAGKLGYAAPCPPTNYQPAQHRYIFTLYALDSSLSLAAGATRAEVESALSGHVLAQTTLTGLYQRVSTPDSSKMGN